MTTAELTPDLGVDERLCLALHQAARAMTSTYRPILAPLGLTYPQYLVMALLWEDGTSSVGWIGSRLLLDTNTLSPLLKRLERLGLVARTRDTDDERIVLVSLTTAGKRLKRSAADVPAQIGEATGLGLPEQARLVATLRRLTGHLGPRPT